MSLLSLPLYSTLYSTLVNSLLIITNRSDIFDLTCCNLSGGFFFSSRDIRCAWLRTGERYVCAICDGIFRIRVIGTVLYYQSKWIPTSERDVQYIPTLYLLLFYFYCCCCCCCCCCTTTGLEILPRLDWIGFSSFFLGTCRTLSLNFTPPPPPLHSAASRGRFEHFNSTPSSEVEQSSPKKKSNPPKIQARNNPKNGSNPSRRRPRSLERLRQNRHPIHSHLHSLLLAHHSRRTSPPKIPLPTPQKKTPPSQN